MYNTLTIAVNDPKDGILITSIEDTNMAYLTGLAKDRIRQLSLIGVEFGVRIDTAGGKSYVFNRKQNDFK